MSSIVASSSEEKADVSALIPHRGSVVGQLFAVLGCGIIGLCVALELVFAGKKVIIYSKSTPFQQQLDPTYASSKSGAHWFSFADNTNALGQNRDRQTFHRLWGLAKEYPASETGLTIVKGNALYEQKPVGWSGLWWHSLTPNFRYWTDEECEVFSRDKGTRITFAYSYHTVMMHPDRYLCWLYLKFTSLGGRVVVTDKIHSIATLAEKTTPFTAVVNCTGLGASKLADVHDTQLHATRGRTIIVYFAEITEIWRIVNDKNPTYVLPRGDGTVVLGGSYEHDNVSLQTDDQQMAESIMKRCIAIVPSLAKAHRLSESCGLRPDRGAVARLEIGTHENWHTLVVHCYGHAGWGMQSSWGCADEVVRLLTVRSKL